MEIYCTKCHSKKELQGGTEIITTDGKLAAQIMCDNCGVVLFWDGGLNNKFWSYLR